MKRKKRIFAILLSLVVMMMYAMPLSAFAQEAEAADTADTYGIHRCEHNWVEVSNTATCLLPGIVKYQCQKSAEDGHGGCGAVKYEKSSALGHAWSEWRTVIKPTADKDGLAKRTCTRHGCIAIDYMRIPATGGGEQTQVTSDNVYVYVQVLGTSKTVITDDVLKNVVGITSTTKTPYYYLGQTTYSDEGLPLASTKSDPFQYPVSDPAAIADSIASPNANSNFNADNVEWNGYIHVASGADNSGAPIVDSSQNTYHLDGVVQCYTVSYANGDTVLQSSVAVKGTSTPEYTGTIPAAEGKRFAGWGTVSDTVQGDVTYYAQWEDIPAGTVPVAVYATDGSQSGRNDALEEILNIEYKQPDGYYPIGVIYLSEDLFKNGVYNANKTEKCYINSEEDWNAVYKALGTINESCLQGADTGLKNSNNEVEANLQYVQKDIGKYSGSYCTALFDWNVPEVEGAIAPVNGETGANGYYRYHLDLRFATGVVKYNLGYDGAPSIADTVGLIDSVADITANPTRDGYKFAGWVAENSDSESPVYGIGEDWEDTITLSQPEITLIARWEEVVEEESWPVYLYIRIFDEKGNDIIKSVTPEGNVYKVNGIEFKANADTTATEGWFTIGQTDDIEVVNPAGEEATPITGAQLKTLLEGLDIGKVDNAPGNNDNLSAVNALWGAIEWEKLHVCPGAQDFNTEDEILANKTDKTPFPNKWHLDGNLYVDKLAYDANEGTGEMSDTYGFTNADVNITACGFTRTGYTFTGWNTAADGSGTSYPKEAGVYTLTSGDDVLYAQWEQNSDPGSGSGSGEEGGGTDSGTGGGSGDLDPSGGGTTPITPGTPEISDPTGPSEPGDSTDTEYDPAGDVDAGDADDASSDEEDDAYADDDSESDAVKTGDETMLAMWLVIATLAALGLCGTLAVARRKEN